MDKVQRGLLERLKELFDDGDIAAVIKKEGEDDYPTDILTTIHPDFGAGDDDALGEYFFMDDEDSDYTTFNVVITFTESLNGLFLGKVYEAVAKLNYYIPDGNFGVDALDRRLIFKSSQLISKKMTPDEMYDVCDVCVGNALDTADRFMELLMQISLGNADPDDAVSVVTGVNLK